MLYNISMNKPLEQLTIEELKSLAYDQMVELGRVQKNLQIIEARIVELAKLSAVEVKTDEKNS